MLKRIVVVGLAAALVGIPVAIAKTSSPSPDRAPAVKPAAVKPVAQKSPAAAKKRDQAYAKANSRHDGPCRDDAITDTDL